MVSMFLLIPQTHSFFFIILPALKVIKTKMKNSFRVRMRRVTRAKARIYVGQHGAPRKWGPKWRNTFSARIHQCQRSPSQISSYVSGGAFTRETKDCKITLILQSDVSAKLFREHAQKSLCAENVDFCLELLAFKNRVNNWIGGPPTRSVELHTNLISIIDEFIADDSPSEVNISSNQKKTILKLRDFENFSILQ